MIPFGLPWRLIGAAGLVLALLGLVHSVLRAEQEKGRAQVRAVYAQAEQDARIEQQRMATLAASRQREVYDSYRQRLAREEARAAAARSELERVRVAADALGGGAAAGDAAAACRADDTRALVGLLREGAGLVEEGSRRLGVAAEKLTALQDVAAALESKGNTP